MTVRRDGSPVFGTGAPSSETPTHLAAHRARADLGVVVHSQPARTGVLAATGTAIRLITLDHAYCVRLPATVGYLPSGSAELAAAVAERLGSVDVVVLGHHGYLVVASDADLAFDRVANLKAAASATSEALLLDDIHTVCPPECLARVVAREAAAKAER